MQKIKIIVRLPGNRDFAGQIHIENAAGKRLAGPFPACGRADDKLARENKNPGRDPLLPFGDLPLGEYQLRQIIESGTDTPYPGGEFGSAGIILLQPKEGEAALADANGRFGFFIQGGALSRDGRLRPTDGSLRLSNRHQRKFISVLRRFDGVDCQCLVLGAGNVKKGRKVAVTVVPGLLAQGKALLSGLLGAGAVEPAHRSLLRKMLLAGRISMSIPSLLMLSTHAAFSQHTSGSESGNLLLAGRDSVPVMFADATGTGSSHDYSGQLPDTTHANQDANTVSDGSHQAANDANLEQAKHDSGVGFDTPGPVNSPVPPATPASGSVPASAPGTDVTPSSTDNGMDDGADNKTDDGQTDTQPTPVAAEPAPTPVLAPTPQSTTSGSDFSVHDSDTTANNLPTGNVPVPNQAYAGQPVVDKAHQLLKNWNDNPDLTYQQVPDANYPKGNPNISTDITSDCSHFVHEALQQSGHNVTYVTARTDSGAWIGRSADFQEISSSEATPGDVIVLYPKNGEAHMGIYSGTRKRDADGKLYPYGIAFGASDMVSEAPWSAGGGSGTVVPNGGTIKYYRPLK